MSLRESVVQLSSKKVMFFWVINTNYNYINIKFINGILGRRQLFKLDLVKLKQHSVVKVGEWLSLREGTGLNITDFAVFFDQNNPPNVTLVVITILVCYSINYFLITASSLLFFVLLIMVMIILLA